MSMLDKGETSRRHVPDFDTIITAAMCVTAVLLTALLVATYFAKENQDHKDAIPHATLVQFLDEYILATSYDDEERVVEKYFVGAEKSEKDTSGRSAVLRDLNSVFVKWRGPAVGYKIVDAHRNYVELVLLDENDTVLYPRIGILYNTTGTRISNFSIFRLQPLSDKDTEWRGEWR